MPVGARRTYRSLLKWERKLPCATPLDGIARDLGAFWLLDQWFTVGLHGWAESMISSSLSDRNRTFCQSVFRASDAANPKYVPLLKEHRDMLFDRVRGGVAGLDSAAMDYVGLRADRGRLLNDVPGTGAWNTDSFPPDGWREQLGWTPPV